MGTLAAGIAHEINNPLGTMTVMVETLSKRHQDLPEDVLNVLTTDVQVRGRARRREAHRVDRREIQCSDGSAACRDASRG